MRQREPLRHAWLRALGREDLPPEIQLADGTYRHRRTYKHDFFAATGLYEGPGGRVILKVGRVAPLFGLPMVWLGRMLCRHELDIYLHLQSVEGVPRCLGQWSRTGLVHAFVEGHPLQRRERVDDAFFPRLARLIEALHERQVAYVDLEKRENILVDAQGRPALIDFQISWWWPAERRQRRGWNRWLPDFIGRFILARLQAGDRYHLLKHQRRHRPDTLTPEQLAASYRAGVLIHVHRWLGWPLQAIRRTILRLLTGRWRSARQDGPEFTAPLPEPGLGAMTAGEKRGDQSGPSAGEASGP